ncbi:MAG TPA: DUF4178 domain-containing protein [Longimicrobiaceae bacterium]|nr:DUF4178 domain-containing protein [Longimicrobiaceae bacterium]
MSGPVANCPSCGGPVEFHWAGAVQTVCGYCSSILVRHDMDLAAVGRKSLPPPSTSPIRVGTRGRYRDRPFEVTGRIVYEYERGGWSEWHLALGDGRSGWLSDAQAEYAVTFLAPDPGPLPSPNEIQRGQRFRWGGTEYAAAAVTRARYAGVEGELPFEYWDKETVPFVDLKSTEEGRFATLDYSEPRPLLFLGEYVAWNDLHLTDLREAEPARAAGTRALNCPACGSGVVIRDPEHSLTVVCESCGSMLDAKSPSLRVLQEYRRKTGRVKPLIPLGATGKWKGDPYQVLGFQQRTIRVEGTDYSWREYLLYNPRQGYRYLTEYDGHWNDVITLKTLPQEGRASGRPVARLHGETFKHFQKAEARTTFVLGEFPWEVRYDDRVLASDYISPPRMLSAETADGETTWSLGEYVPGAKVWEAFSLPGRPPRPKGVFANQPSPHAGRMWAHWKAFGLLFLVWLVFALGRLAVGSEPVLTQRFSFYPATDTGAVVTEPFVLTGRAAALGVDVETDVANNWVYLNYALINQETGQATEFGREVSYYFGSDGGENWTEGSRDDEARVPEVPPGRYVLRIEPEGPGPVNYTLRVHRDVPSLGFFLVALLVLALPPVFASLGAGAFEMTRWEESDYGSSEDDE